MQKETPEEFIAKRKRALEALTKEDIDLIAQEALSKLTDEEIEEFKRDWQRRNN